MRGLKYVSWADNTGYAVAARAYLRALAASGVELTWTPMLTGRRADGRYAPVSASTLAGLGSDLRRLCQRPVDYDTVLLHTVPEYYPYWLVSERRRGRRLFGYTVWELDRLPRHWPGILNRLDGVLVPCRWNADVFRQSGVRVPIHVVPHLSQFEGMAAPSAAALAAMRLRLGGPARMAGRFVFCTVAVWSRRKAPELALAAYFRAFAADQPVLLVLKTSRYDVTRRKWHWQWRGDGGWRSRLPCRRFRPARATCRELVVAQKHRAAVVLIDDEGLADEQMLALHHLSDCHLSLPRAEGFGLGTYEAALLGKPVVTTGYGGQLDYLPPDLAWLVGYRMTPVDEPFWRGGYTREHRWAAPDVDQAASHLGRIVAHPAAARERAGLLARRLGVELGRDQVVRAMLAALG